MVRFNNIMGQMSGMSQRKKKSRVNPISCKI